MKKIYFFVAALAIIVGSCKSLNNTQKGTGIGAAAGAVAGGLIFKNTAAGAIIGAAVGGGAGYAIGRHMDKQAKAIKAAIPDAEVTRVGEGIEMTFNSALLFQINSAELSTVAKTDLDKLAGVFVQYPETNILVEGHTDDTGSDDYNMKLSEKRANAVTGYLENKGLAATRFTVKWYGETQPKYPNDSDSNRVKNRRVELAIYANDKMKKDAEDGQLGQ
ncbi:OmpA family protein [Panacibacter ginsenosidivorans]|uniref:OmpA family protein n=1 Tax=Panacibacter ginsenosidivorans TaxID=1813871 RepID=A0A5B8V8C9_9BACT|nr:OmpA family protein [Panacibacter ginsenosidivorans]QEC67790.1 OmpA family protein [Panacibacter ginsenosidivorans]